MAYDEGLARRIRDVLEGESGLTERRIISGLSFMVGGHIACGVNAQGLLVRVRPAEQDWALRQDHVRPFALGEKRPKGWVVVGPEGVASDDDLERWVRTGLEYARTLPAK